MELLTLPLVHILSHSFCQPDAQFGLAPSFFSCLVGLLLAETRRNHFPEEFMSEALCFCGSGAVFTQCCGAVINGERLASTPEELMRSRYSAHCAHNYAYLIESTHPDRRDEVTADEIENWAKNVEWTGLEIHAASPGTTDEEGHVSFTAHFAIGGTPQSMREDADFLLQDGRWYYVDGQYMVRILINEISLKRGVMNPAHADQEKNTKNVVAPDCGINDTRI